MTPLIRISVPLFRTLARGAEHFDAETLFLRKNSFVLYLSNKCPQVDLRHDNPHLLYFEYLHRN